jgi:hypothetical protein
MLAGPLMACGAPFLLGGGLALAYDITMWQSFRNVAAAAVARGRHRLRRRTQALPPNPTDIPTTPSTSADSGDGPPTITIPTTIIDDTVPLNLAHDPVERVRAHRLATADTNAPRGLAKLGGGARPTPDLASRRHRS